MASKRIAILGSTGSIGRQALDFISRHEGLEVCALAGGANWQALAKQAQVYRPDIVSVADEKSASELKNVLPPGIEVLVGAEGLVQLVRRSRPDILLSAIVGSAGLAPTLAAIECGCALAIANKETLVMAGGIIMPLVRQANIPLPPVDSEHSAIFQCLQAGKRNEVRNVVITASGGALRNWQAQDVANATVEDALNHPTWQMGRKITIDSATLINKALEIVEAHWLFGLSADQIKVLLHGESIIHSYIEYQDGSVIAQMGKPDMTLPIAYALCYPDRPSRTVEPLDLARMGKLTFKPLCSRFTRAVALGYEVIRRGGCSGAVLNAANEEAVQAFLNGKILFGQIVPMVEDILNRCPVISELTLQALMDADKWARQQVALKVGK